MSPVNFKERTMDKTKKLRLIGVDVARGIALLGMMAIHILPAWNDDFEPTVVWTVFSGASAALFATLAGVGLGFASGGTEPLSGALLTQARRGLALRAAIVALIGLLVAYLEPPAAIILAYYGVMFLMAIPFLGWGIRRLAAVAAAFAVAGPVFLQLVRDNLPAEDGLDPHLGTLLSDPGGTISTILFTGSYPAAVWMAFICAGMAIGRLDLRSVSVQARLLASGAGLAVATWLASVLLMGPLGGTESLIEANRGLMTEEMVTDTLTWGPDPALTTTSWWWLGVLSPYSSMPLEVLNTLGLAVAVLGAMLLLANRIGSALVPLAAAGAMTLTLYTAHLVMLAVGLLVDRPNVDFVVQAAVLVLFAVIWRNTRGGQGPLERVVARSIQGSLSRLPSQRTVAAAPEDDARDSAP